MLPHPCALDGPFFSPSWQTRKLWFSTLKLTLLLLLVEMEQCFGYVEPFHFLEYFLIVQDTLSLLSHSWNKFCSRKVMAELHIKFINKQLWTAWHINFVNNYELYAFISHLRKYKNSADTTLHNWLRRA